ncbi:MAG: hypothetical protein V8T90_00100 [Victivallales bacterium]
MSENIYTIPGLISHVTPEVEQSPTPNQLRLAVTFPDRLILSSNEQIGVLMDFAASVPATIAASRKAYCQRIMTDVTRNNATERFSCVFYIDTVPLQLKSLTEEDQNELYCALRQQWRNAVLTERLPQAFILEN